MAAVAKKCYYSNTSKIILLFDFYSRTSTPNQAEDLNTLIGNAFRIAYASQIQEEKNGFNLGDPVYPAFRASRSADSLLSPDVLNGTPEDLGIADLDEPVYEIPDFNRSSRFRHSEQTFNRYLRISIK